MEDKLKIKLDDFTQWALSAFEHYSQKRYSDALVNMRKAGEAACKLVVYLKYSEFTAMQKIGQKSFKELIELLIAGNLVPRKAINLLEVFQIYGNLATHDNRIDEKHAFYAHAALILFSDWIFTEHLRILIPAKIKKFMIPVLPRETALKETEKKEMDALKKENELLKKEILFHIDKLERKENESSIYREHASETRQELSGIKEQVSALLTETKKSAGKTEAEYPAIPAPRPSKKIRIAVVIFFVISVIAFSIYYLAHSKQSMAKAPIVAPDSLFNVIVLPFAVMQDNPGINLKLEEFIIRKAAEKYKWKKWPINILYFPEETEAAKSYEQVYTMAKQRNAQLVIFGDLFEQTATDSVQAALNFFFLDYDNSTEIKINGYVADKTFSRLTDAAATQLQSHAEATIEMFYVKHVLYKKEYYKALALMNQIEQTTDFMKFNFYEMKTNCYVQLGDYAKAKPNAEQMILMDGGSASSYQYLGKIYIGLNDYDRAAYCYEKSIDLDTLKTMDYLLNYADLLCASHFKNYDRARHLTFKAISYDSTRAVPWYYLAEIEKFRNEFTRAEECYLKALRLDTAYLRAKVGYAHLLAMNLNNPQAALLYLQSALQQDSTDYYAHFISGDVYNLKSVNKPTLAQYHYNKSKQYNPQETPSYYLVMAYAETMKNNYVAAKQYSMAAYALDTNNAMAYAYIGSCCYGLSQWDSAVLFLNKAIEKDPFNEIAQHHLGMMYADINFPSRNMGKAAEFLEKARQVNPDWLGNNNTLAEIYFKMEEYEKSKRIYEEMLRQHPNDLKAFQMLSHICIKQQNYDQAMAYLEKAITLAPQDDLLHSYFSVVFFQLKDYQRAFTHAEKAVKINPNIAMNHYRMAEIYISFSKFALARKSYEQALELNPSLKDPEMEKWFN